MNLSVTIKDFRIFSFYKFLAFEIIIIIIIVVVVAIVIFVVVVVGIYCHCHCHCRRFDVIRRNAILKATT